MPDFYDMSTTQLSRWLLDHTEKLHVQYEKDRITVFATVYNKKRKTEWKFDTSMPTLWMALIHAAERVWHLLNGKYE